MFKKARPAKAAGGLGNGAKSAKSMNAKLDKGPKTPLADLFNILLVVISMFHDNTESYQVIPATHLTFVRYQLLPSILTQRV